MRAFSLAVNSRLASSATRSTSCSETVIGLSRFRKIYRPYAATAGETRKGRLVKQREIARQRSLTHVVPVDLRLQRLDRAAVILLKFVVRNILQHLFFAAKSQRRGAGEARTERHMHHFQVGKLWSGPNQAHVAPQHIP